MKTSDAGLNLIAKFEGIRLECYNDPAGHCTIGIGHLIHKGACTQADRQSWGRLTEQQAYDLLRADIVRYEKPVNDLVTVPLSQNHFDALVSLTYNIGGGNFKRSTLLKKLNAGDYGAAAQEFGKWNKAGGKVLSGLTRRRTEEAALFQTSDGPITGPVNPKEDPLVVSDPFFIISAASGLALESATPLDTGAEVALIQAPLHAGSKQQWRLDAVEGLGVGAGEVRIINEFHGRVLDVAGFSLKDKARVILFPWHGGPNQRWLIKKLGPNDSVLVNVHSGKALDVPGGTPDAGVQLEQFSVLDNANQRFHMSYVNAPSPVPAPRPSGDSRADLRTLGFSHGDEEDVRAFQQGFSFWDLKVDGALGEDTRKAIAHCLANGNRVGKFFLWTEFRSRGDKRIKAHRQLIRRLDTLRERVGPITVISGYRDPERNAQVNGAKHSQHVHATAADVAGVCVERLAKELGFSGIGVTKRTGRVAHLDVRAEGPKNTTGAKVGAPTIWFYN